MSAFNSVIKLWLIMGTLDVLGSLFIYSMTVESWAVYFSLFPTIALALIIVPIQRMINQIDNQFKKQNGICYNCNLRIVDKDTAVLEDETGKVYCADCHHKLYGHLYVNRGGVWYKK